MLSFILDKELASEAYMISSQTLIIYRNILPFTFQELKFEGYFNNKLFTTNFIQILFYS